MITAVVLAKNEEKNIADCMKSLLFCHEVLVIDDFSTDKTRTIAKDLGAKVLKRSLDNDFAAQRNFGLKKAKNDWVLFVDADERVDNDLRKEILKKVGKDEFSGYYIGRRDFMWGRELTAGEAGSIKLLRLGKKGIGKWERQVHEYWDIRDKVGKLSHSLLHYPHPTLSSFIGSVNKMSSLHAKANNKEGKRSSLLIILFWPLAHLSGGLKTEFGALFLRWL